jgi:hypothetical protein
MFPACPHLRFQASMAALSVLLIHSETVILLTFAANSTALIASGENLTGTIRPLASPFGSFGRPILAFFARFPELLNDCRLHGCPGRYNRRDVQYGYVALWLVWIFRLVNPCIDTICLWMPLQTKDFHDPIPYRFALE